MKIGLLVIASEILEGKIQDLNTRFLAEFLNQQNQDLTQVLTVRDHPEEILNGLNFLKTTCNLIVTSGGLGPTKDDVTLRYLGESMGKGMEFSEQACAVAFANYQQFDRIFPGKEHIYSFLPQGFMALKNPAGFAPAYQFQNQEHSYLLAPGVPKEFRAIMEIYLRQLLPPSNFLKQNLTFKTKRIPEEKIFGEVDPSLWEKLSAYGEVSSLPYLMGVDVGVKLTAAKIDDLQLKIAAVTDIMKNSPVWKNVWHMGQEKLEEVIVSKAKRLNIKFSFAESATGGLCAHRITNVPGSSSVFLGSLVTYSDLFKNILAKVDPIVIKNYGVVSVETANAMATGCRETLGVDIAISITGIAGPNGGNLENPVGTVCLGIATSKGATGVKLKLFGDREQLKERFSQAALFLLLEAMEEIA
jgi:nicotinamide-nucleotide amidase